MVKNSHKYGERRICKINDALTARIHCRPFFLNYFLYPKKLGPRTLKDLTTFEKIDKGIMMNN